MAVVDGAALRTMSASEFVRRMKASLVEPDRHYVLWLGAGCSVTSGIPAASSLVRDHWLPRLHQLRGGNEDVETWAAKAFATYRPDDPARLYGPLMDELFMYPEERQRETERLCDGRQPGFGYAVVAALMSRLDGAFGTVLTTNFDDLVADAMYVFGERRPLVIQHEALAGFVRPGHVQRPLVVKVHGDHRLNPMHTADETAKLKTEVATGIERILHDRGLVFIGYSGNDRGVLEALQKLPVAALPLGVWWVSRREPQGEILDWLVSRNAVWVRADDFDQLMLLFQQEFGIDHPNAKKFERMFTGYRETFEQLNSAVDELPDTGVDSAPLKEAARRATRAAPNWWGVELDARRYKRSDPKRADEIYRDGVERVHDARLYLCYANFLSDVLHEFDRAQELYERALADDPNDPIYLGNYANLLTDDLGEHDRAQALYERGVAADPNDALLLGNYAAFLSDVRGEHERARELYERALASNPNEASSLGNFARLLFETGEDGRAYELAMRAFRVAEEDDDDLRAELWLYLLALGPPEGRAEAISELAALIEAGVRSPAWDFSRILARAHAEGRADVEWLERVVDVIAAGADPGVLRDWPDWPDE